MLFSVVLVLLLSVASLATLFFLVEAFAVSLASLASLVLALPSPQLVRLIAAGRGDAQRFALYIGSSLTYLELFCSHLLRAGKLASFETIGTTNNDSFIITR